MTFKARLLKYYWFQKFAFFSGLNLIPLKSMAKVQQTPLKHDVAIQNKQAETMVKSPYPHYLHFLLLSVYICVRVYICLYICLNICTHTQMVVCRQVRCVF